MVLLGHQWMYRRRAKRLLFGYVLTVAFHHDHDMLRIGAHSDFCSDISLKRKPPECTPSSSPVPGIVQKDRSRSGCSSPSEARREKSMERPALERSALAVSLGLSELSCSCFWSGARKQPDWLRESTGHARRDSLFLIRPGFQPDRPPRTAAHDG
jgi:hypothetical protein